MKIANPRLHWDAEYGWIVDVPVTLTSDQLSRIAKWALPHQAQRLAGLPPGDLKDECKRSIEELKKGNIQQRLINNSGDGAVFSATERTRPDRKFFH